MHFQKNSTLSQLKDTLHHFLNGIKKIAKLEEKLDPPAKFSHKFKVYPNAPKETN